MNLKRGLRYADEVFPDGTLVSLPTAAELSTFLETYNANDARAEVLKALIQDGMVVVKLGGKLRWVNAEIDLGVQAFGLYAESP